MRGGILFIIYLVIFLDFVYSKPRFQRSSKQNNNTKNRKDNADNELSISIEDQLTTPGAEEVKDKSNKNHYISQFVDHASDLDNESHNSAFSSDDGKHEAPIDTSGHNSAEKEKVHIGEPDFYINSDELGKHTSAEKGKADIGDPGFYINSYEFERHKSMEAGSGYAPNYPNYSYDEDNAKLKLKADRPLIVGDTFTPHDMLPITIKLIAKVDEPGTGKGIVSSSKNAQELADKLFEAFFASPSRIVYLKSQDLPGIDALQALALSGEAADLRTKVEAITEPSSGFQGKVGRLRSMYRLVTKKISTGDSKDDRRAIALAKKLNKKRRLIVKSRRGEKKSNDKTKSGRRRTKHRPSKRWSNKKMKRIGSKMQPNDIKSQKTNSKMKSNGPRQTKTTKRISTKKTKKQNKKRKGKSKTTNKNFKKSTSIPPCRWRYECENPADLDTCRLQTDCMIPDARKFSKYIGLKYRPDEDTPAIKQFRKMLGITLIDEEVEKILENRILLMKPENMKGASNVESLAQYFNRIIMAENLESTTPSPFFSDHEIHGRDSDHDEHIKDSDHEEHENRNDHEEDIKSIENGNKEEPVVEQTTVMTDFGENNPHQTSEEVAYSPPKVIESQENNPPKGRRGNQETGAYSTPLKSATTKGRNHHNGHNLPTAPTPKLSTKKVDVKTHYNKNA